MFPIPGSRSGGDGSDQGSDHVGGDAERETSSSETRVTNESAPSPLDTSTRPLTMLSGIDTPWWLTDEAPPARRRLDRLLVGVVVVLSALVLVVGAFLVGRLVSDLFAGMNPDEGGVVATPGVPLPPGEYRWDVLQGGECVQPYESPWARKFVVVDCAVPHASQLVHVAQWPGEQATVFPGQNVLAEEIAGLCKTASVFRPDVFQRFKDLRVQGSFPVNASQWDAGQRFYYCFVTQASGEPLTGSLL